MSANAKKETFVGFVSTGLILTKMRLFGTKHFCMYCTTERGKNDCSVHRTVKRTATPKETSLEKIKIYFKLEFREWLDAFAVSYGATS